MPEGGGTIPLLYRGSALPMMNVFITAPMRVGRGLFALLKHMNERRNHRQRVERRGADQVGPLES